VRDHMVQLYGVHAMGYENVYPKKEVSAYSQYLHARAVPWSMARMSFVIV
jgi:hypothetical protein